MHIVAVSTNGGHQLYFFSIEGDEVKKIRVLSENVSGKPVYHFFNGFRILEYNLCCTFGEDDLVKRLIVVRKTIVIIMKT